MNRIPPYGTCRMAGTKYLYFRSSSRIPMCDYFFVIDSAVSLPKAMGQKGNIMVRCVLQKPLFGIETIPSFQNSLHNNSYSTVDSIMPGPIADNTEGQVLLQRKFCFQPCQYRIVVQRRVQPDRDLPLSYLHSAPGIVIKREMVGNPSWKFLPFCLVVEILPGLCAEIRRHQWYAICIALHFYGDRFLSNPPKNPFVHGLSSCMVLKMFDSCVPV